jgi:hypothetical protein
LREERMASSAIRFSARSSTSRILAFCGTLAAPLDPGMSGESALGPRPPFQPAAHQADQMRYVHWLGDVFGRAGGDRFSLVALVIRATGG